MWTKEYACWINPWLRFLSDSQAEWPFFQMHSPDVSCSVMRFSRQFPGESKARGFAALACIALTVAFLFSGGLRAASQSGRGNGEPAHWSPVSQAQLKLDDK